MLAEEEIIGIGTVDAADLIGVAETFGDQERRLRTCALQHRVDRNCGAMQENVGFAKLEASLVDAVRDAFDQLLWGRERLAIEQFARVLAEGSDVGEGSADIGCEAGSEVAVWCCGVCHSGPSHPFAR